MLPIIVGFTRSSVSIDLGKGKKKWGMSYSFHVDTGEMVQKAGMQVQHAVEKGCKEVSGLVKRKVEKMKLKRTCLTLRRSLLEAIAVKSPLKMLRSRMRKIVHA